MTIDEVQQAIVSGQTVRHTHGGITADVYKRQSLNSPMNSEVMIAGN